MTIQEIVEKVLTPQLLTIACKTEGNSYDTGLQIQGFEVWGIPPNRYRHYTEFYLRHSQPFNYEVRQLWSTNKSSTWWDIGFETSDGRWNTTWTSFKTKEIAQSKIPIYTKGQQAYATCHFRVFYTRTGKADGSFCDKANGIACGAVWFNDHQWDAFNFKMSSKDAQMVLDFQEKVQSEWETRAANWRKYEAEKLEVVAYAVASESLSSNIISSLYGPTECLECGAVYDEPGHVEESAMGCKKCD